MNFNETTRLWEFKYWHPAVTTDAVIFGYDQEEKSLQILLIRRAKAKPGEQGAFEGYWALPGGFLKVNEPTDECVKRELMEETYMNIFDNDTRLSPEFIEQLHTFSGLDRDPREYVMTVAYYALVKKDKYKIRGGDDAAEARWFPVNELPENLAFDLAEIIRMAIERLRMKIHFSPIGFHLLDESFTLAQLKSIYEVILDTTLDRGNFRKKMLALKYIRPTGKKDTGHAHRSADFYSFEEEAYNHSKKIGMHLEF